LSGVDPERGAGSRLELVEVIRAEIERDGRITFARFMELAVSHPEYGYYTSGDLRTGFGGDFLTAPETDPIFGQTVARQLIECWERLTRPTPFTIREAGAGRGMLAAHILSEIAERAPGLYTTLRYELSDLNPVRIDEALEFLAGHGFGAQSHPASDTPITGVLLANELLDAFPVHRLVRRGGSLQEIYVTFEDGWFRDEVGPLSDPSLADLLCGAILQDGQSAEVSPAAVRWAKTISSQLSTGYALLIDYGYPASELYSAVRFDGTLKGYSQHDVTDDPYRRVGNQDLTAHVNFTAVSHAAQSSGLVELGLTTQAYFLAGLGIEQVLMEMQQTVSTQDYITARNAVMHLIDPRGLGRFRVLILGKNVDPEPRLRGLSFTL
jgi:SAM-dependent MidA family methyltransferase